LKKEEHRKPAGPFFEGLEIGAVSVKWVRRTPDGDTRYEIAQHGGNPKKKVQEIFNRYKTEYPSRIVVTGEAARIFLDLPYRSETECIEKALSFYGLKPDILLSLGGETFSVYPVKDGTIKNIVSTSKCAAGTGEFLVQQFQRMGFSLAEGLDQSRTGKIIQLATRCSVHCKSDATHKLNKGECKPVDIAKSLVHDLAKKVGEMVEMVQWPTTSMVISGGVSLNDVFVDNFRRIFGDSKITVLPESPYLEAFGASLYASEPSDTAAIPPREKWVKAVETEFETLKPLGEAKPLLDYRVRKDIEHEIIEGASYILGVDAGSTTTKAVLLNVSDGSVGASYYLRTLGNPIRAVKKCLDELIEQRGDKPAKIIQAGVTGSAREIVSVYLDNCLSINEIPAHARAAAEEVPTVDTVFEIGGQDSKFISFLEGVPVDYAMNEGCSAGTGSFLEESASVDMGIAMEDISGIAEKSSHPISFGQRCAAFINTDLKNAMQQGARQEDVIAGLVYSIADNYCSRIVGPRHIGENLMFLGGVALNKSAALAMAHHTRRKIVVPPHPELMGCVGTALTARDRLQHGEVCEEIHQLEDLVRGEIAVKDTFRCKSCENRCEIQRIAIRGKVYPFGGLCSKYETLRHGADKAAEGCDLVAVRNQMMFDEFGSQPARSPRGTIGLPMALSTYELFPFFAKLIEELGFNAVLSNPSKIGNRKATSAICYPCEIVHGAFYDLINQNADFIFLPRLIEMKIPAGGLHSYTCPSTSIIPDVIRAAFEKSADRILSPHIGLNKNLLETTLDEIGEMGPALGVTKDLARRAGKKALSHYENFRETLCRRGKETLENLKDEPAVILAGRPYITCCPEVNLALPRKFSSRGYHVLPVDMLPELENASHPRDVWHFTRQISNAVAHVKKTPHLYMCLVSCFSCGPDSSMYHFFRRELAGRAFCYLEIDSHTAHAGFETRVGAFLDIIEERRQKQKRSARKKLPLTGTAGTLQPDGFRPDGFRLARLSDNLDCIIDSDGNRVDYHDPRVVHVWAINHSSDTLQMIAGVYEKSKRKFRPVEPTNPEVMQVARKLCSGRECVPMTAMTGAILKDIYNHRNPNEITIYFKLDQQGPCQNGAWPLVWEVFCKRLKLRNVISGIIPSPANHRLGLGAGHSKAVDLCVLLGDFFTEAKLTLRCLAREIDSALKIFDIEFKRFIECLKKEDGDMKPVLQAWAEKMAGIPLKAPVAEIPKILIFGGLNLLFVHKPVTDYFLEQGILPKVVDFIEGACWLGSESIVRYGFKKGLVTPGEQFSCTPRKKDGKEALEVRKSKLGLRFIDSIQKELRSIMGKSGLLFDEHIPFPILAESGHPYASYNGFTETSTTTGRYICTVERGFYDGLVNLGSFNCQPAMNAQAIIRPLANKSDIPYVAIDCEGPWISTNQRRLLESIAVQARRTNKRRRR